MKDRIETNFYLDSAVKISIWQIPRTTQFMPILEFLSKETDEESTSVWHSNAYRLFSTFSEPEYAAEFIYQKLLEIGVNLIFPDGYEFGEFDIFEWDEEAQKQVLIPKKIKVQLDISQNYQGLINYVPGPTTRQ